MSATISKFQLVGPDDREVGGLYDTFADAIAAAQNHGDHAVIEITYEYSDSELAWTPDGGDRWPPK